MIKITYENGQEEQFWDLNDLLYRKLYDGSIDFHLVTETFVHTLQVKEQQARIQQSEAEIIAVYASGHAYNLNIQEEAKQDLAKRYLVNYGNLNDKFREKLQQEVAESNINIDGSNGFGDLYYRQGVKENG